MTRQLPPPGNPGERPQRRRSRRLALAVLPAAGIALAMSILSAAPVAADHQRLLLSSDGATYSPVLSQWFATGPPLVPGGSIDGSIWVKNASAEPAVLASAVLVRRADTALTRNVVVHVASRGPSRPVALDGPWSCAPTQVSISLAPNEAAEMRLEVAMDAGAPNATRGQSADLALTLVMQDEVDGVPRADPCAGRGTGTNASADAAGRDTTRATVSLTGAEEETAHTSAAGGTPGRLGTSAGTDLREVNVGPVEQIGPPDDLAPAQSAAGTWIEGNVAPHSRFWYLGSALGIALYIIVRRRKRRHNP